MGKDQCLKRDREASYPHSLDALDSLSPDLFKTPVPWNVPVKSTIPYRQLRTYDFVGIACPTPRTPRTRVLWHLLGLAIIALVVLQALSCRLFFCVALPVGRTSYMDLREVFTEFRLFNQGNSWQSVKPADPAPMLIPRIIHQTYRTRQVPASLLAVMQSWTRVNGQGWQARFYDDGACIDFVRREFPEYLDAYLSLPKDVERSDFFRYMVVLRLGGVYADIDVELRQPLDSVLGPTDTLVVGWEAEVATDAEAFKRHFVRKRQVLQWFFAAAPGHPVLRAACDHIARYARHTFSNNTNRDTLERTGPGMWTDAVLRHAAAHPPTLVNDPWKVRILPRVAFGVHPAGIDGLSPEAKEIVVLHHFLGSWKKRGGWHKRRTVLQILAGAATAALRRHGEAPAAEEPITPSVLPLFPVSAAFSPPFTIMTHLRGEGDMQSGSDVSATLTSWGTWQAAMARPSRRPLAVEALVGSLGPPEQGAVLVDVSAGQGFFSLAAAARGYRVVAFESSARSLEAFSASVVYNGFQDRIRLYNVSLGAAPATLCLRRRVAAADQGAGAGDASTAAAAEVNDAVAAARRRGYGDRELHALPQSECASMAVRQTLAHMLMGGAEAVPSPTAAGTRTGARALAAAGAATVEESSNSNSSTGWNEASLPFRVGALRLSADGWEGWILDGAESWLARHRPGVVLLEYSPALVERASYPGGGVRLLRRLYDMGYVHVAHAGHVCDERWINISRALKAGGATLGDVAAAAHVGNAAGASKSPGSPCASGAGDSSGNGSNGGGRDGCAVSRKEAPGHGMGSAAGSAAGAAAAGDGSLPHQPTWCKLKPELFSLLTERARPGVAENVLFIHHTHASVRDEALSPVPADQSGHRDQPSAAAAQATARDAGVAASAQGPGAAAVRAGAESAAAAGEVKVAATGSQAAAAGSVSATHVEGITVAGVALAGGQGNGTSGGVQDNVAVRQHRPQRLGRRVAGALRGEVAVAG
ncbi:hypothetical protein Agub_g4877 [Astrephomene gubernaculifera]|uniref:tRNA(Phe) (4-demethylwyosine(37)-C(7)) aminocarboxypropyltransferase n=1 Tax=Astrephomene gubernaculifera TaxID=47775 RepID=A0AAD3DKZ2_9CHLO|nr:hypothetical protein Agub_g4877 [Astrephomene gubernaculifera]